jgi:hypothetical protein
MAQGEPGASVAMPRAEVRRDYPRKSEALTSWLAQEIVPGRTTLGEVFLLFGSSGVHIDRPRYGGAFTLEYDLHQLGVRGWVDILAIEFDEQNRVLELSLRSRAILGR